MLELPGPPDRELELMLFWGGGEPTRAVWLWSKTGQRVAWAPVGQA